MHRPLGLGQKSDPDHGERSHPHHTVQVCSGVGASAWGGGGQAGESGAPVPAEQTVLACHPHPAPTHGGTGGRDGTGGRSRKGREKADTPAAPIPLPLVGLTQPAESSAHQLHLLVGSSTHPQPSEVTLLSGAQAVVLLPGGVGLETLPPGFLWSF